MSNNSFYDVTGSEDISQSSTVIQMGFRKQSGDWVEVFHSREIIDIHIPKNDTEKVKASQINFTGWIPPGKEHQFVETNFTMQG